MNTNAVQIITVSDWSRRGSVESILSIQGKETDFVRDSTDSDTEVFSEDGQDVEYEPYTEPEDEQPVVEDSSGGSDNEIISTKVIEVSVRDEGDLEFADSELTDTQATDSDLELCDYWRCAQCGASNNNPMYRYCERCFKVRKNFFPPRPRRKHKRKLTEDSRPLSQDSATENHEKDRLFSLSQGATVMISQKSCPDKELPRTLSQDSGIESQEFREPAQGCSGPSQDIKTVIDEVRSSSNSNKERPVKRRAESAERRSKRQRIELSDDSDSESDAKAVSPLIKTVSDPACTIEEVKVTKKVLSDTVKELDKDNNMCIVCLSEPKSGVFVHGRIAHICCCYKCAVKVWAKAKRCPVCNCKVSNVLRAVVM